MLQIYALLLCLSIMPWRQALRILDSAPDGSEFSATLPQEKDSPVTDGEVGIMAAMDLVTKREILAPVRN
jgi:hypothetical protein